MLLSYIKPQNVSQEFPWTKLEDVFDYIEQNDLEKIYFFTKDNAVSGMDENDFQTFSRELFATIMKLAHSKNWYPSGEFETIEMIHNCQAYSINVHESRPSPNCVYDTIYTITIQA